MHRLSSPGAVTRFKLASWGLFLMWLMIFPTIGVIGCAFFFIDTELMETALYLMLGTTVLGSLKWLIARRARCPICRSLAINTDTCSRHRNAKKLLGSHGLLVACSVIFRKYFRCPYCNEPTSIVARTASSSRRRSH